MDNPHPQNNNYIIMFLYKICCEDCNAVPELLHRAAYKHHSEFTKQFTLPPGKPRLLVSVSVGKVRIIWEDWRPTLGIHIPLMRCPRNWVAKPEVPHAARPPVEVEETQHDSLAEPATCPTTWTANCGGSQRIAAWVSNKQEGPNHPGPQVKKSPEVQQLLVDRQYKYSK